MLYAIAVVLGFLAASLYLILLWLNWNASYWKDRGVPQLAEKKNIVMKIIQMDFDLLNGDMEAYKEFKSNGFGGLMEFFSPRLFATDLELIKKVCIKDFNYFVNQRGMELEDNDPHMHYILGNHTGEAWKTLRSKMTPAFTTGKMKRMFQIFDLSAKKMVASIKKNISEDHDQVEMRKNVQKFTLDIISSAAFGVETNIFDDPDSLYARMGGRISQTFQLGSTMFKFFIQGMSPRVAKLMKIKILDEHADKFFSKVIIDNLNHRQATGTKREDVLQLMLEAKLGQLKEDDESEDTLENKELKDGPKNSTILNDDVIIANCIGFILGGYDTTEAILSFALYELAVCPEIQERLYDEIRAGVEDNDGEFSYDIINSLRYLDMVISETLRKYPPVSRIDRKNSQPYKLPGTNIVLPKDSVIYVPVYAIHHDPEYWPNPEKFDPERFTKENSANRHSSTYLPFGLGPRSCIGNRFALAECKMAVAHLLLNFKLEPCEKTVIPIKLSCQAFIKPADNVCLRVVPR